MPLPGTCQVCNNISRALMICVSCGAKVCVNCIDPLTGSCKKCQDKSREKAL